MTQPTILDAQRIEQLIEIYRDGLLQDTLPFWLRHSIDEEHGGYLTSLNRDGSVIDTDKAMWQQGRFAWLLGKLYSTVEASDEWLAAARSGIEFMNRCGFDNADGRMWFLVERDGRPLRKRRYAFTESFAAIAYGEYARATGSSEDAERASATFERFITHNQQPKDVVPKWESTRQLKGLGFPMITIVTAQELRQSVDLASANDWIEQSIETIERDFVKRESRCVMENVTSTGEISDHFEGRTLNPGHAIEGAWFIMNEGRLRDDSQMITLGCDMLDWMWERGWDEQHGGLLYFVDVHRRPVQEYWHDMKFWWPHNEAIIATLLAWSLTGEERYSTRHQQVHDWTYQHFPDPKHGEWFGYLHRDGTISNELKGNWWKGPFHLPRMQLECWQILERTKSTNVQHKDA